MKTILLKLILKISYWLAFQKKTQLTPFDLMRAGWIENVDHFWVQPSIKDRDRVSIKFENHYFRVYHSEKMTFIALQDSKEWLQLYLSLLDHHMELPTSKIV